MQFIPFLKKKRNKTIFKFIINFFFTPFLINTIHKQLFIKNEIKS
jgi:hypothetical protein